MNMKIIISAVILLAALVFGATSFVENNVEYATLQAARESGKKVQVKGEWLKDQPTSYNPQANTFTFSMRDEVGAMAEVILTGPRPNNFELAEAVVVKGRMGSDGTFEASEMLTKCPSKYEGQDPNGHEKQ